MHSRNWLSLLGLSLLTLHCGKKQTDADNSPLNANAQPATAAVAASPASASLITASACVASQTFPLRAGSDPIVGAWRDSSAGGLTLKVAVTPNPNTLQAYELSLTSGRLTPSTNVQIPQATKIVGAWRSAAGDLVIAWTDIDTHSHLSRVSSGALVDVPVSRSYAEYATDTFIGPLDDPSNSELSGLLSTTAWTYWNNNLCPSDTSSSYTTSACVSYWNRDAAPMRRVAAKTSTGLSVFAVSRVTNSSGSASPTIMSTTNWNSYNELGEDSTAAPSYNPYAVGDQNANTPTAGNSRTLAPGAAGPMIVRGSLGMATAWIDADQLLHMRKVDEAGSPSGKVYTLPFVEPLLVDMAPVGQEVFLTFTTKADRNGHNNETTTLVRVNGALLSDAIITTVPIHVPIGDARIQPLDGNDVLFWSPTSGKAVVMQCGLLSTSVDTPTATVVEEE